MTGCIRVVITIGRKHNGCFGSVYAVKSEVATAVLYSFCYHLVSRWSEWRYEYMILKAHRSGTFGNLTERVCAEWLSYGVIILRAAVDTDDDVYTEIQRKKIGYIFIFFIFLSLRIKWTRFWLYFTTAEVARIMVVYRNIAKREK